MVKKRYQDGGVVGNTNYPFGQNQMSSYTPPAPAPAEQGPLVQVNTPDSDSVDLSKPFGMKRGGTVKSHRGDGIAQRGKTKGLMVKMSHGGKTR